MKNDLFNETSVLIDCLLRDKIFTIALINIDATEYAFVGESVAQSLCEALKIESVQLIKKRLIRVYDDRKDQIITHVIYSKMIIQRHTENLILMLIIKLRQQILILDKSWMRKHEISYHEKTNIIEFTSDFCTHSREIRTKTTKTKTSNKEKIFSFEKKSFLSQSDHVKSDSLSKDSKSMIVIKVLSRKKVKSDQSTISLSRKDKKATISIDKSENLNTIRDFRFNLNELEIFNSKEKKSLSVMNIAMIEASTFNMMSKRKNVNLFFVILKNVEKHL
jgi:hypothetical protein